MYIEIHTGYKTNYSSHTRLAYSEASLSMMIPAFSDFRFSRLSSRSLTITFNFLSRSSAFAITRSRLVLKVRSSSVHGVEGSSPSSLLVVLRSVGGEGEQVTSDVGLLSTSQGCPSSALGLWYLGMV